MPEPIKPVRPTRTFSFEVDAVSYAIYAKWIKGHKCRLKKPHIFITISGTQFGKYVEARCKCGQYIDLSAWDTDGTDNQYFITKENKK